MLTVGKDTFISTVDADDHFSVHLEESLWSSYSQEKKEAALRGAFFRIFAVCNWEFDSADAPPIVKIAQCEWALEYTKQQQKDIKKSVVLKSMKAGPAEMKFEHSKDDGYAGANDWIKQMLSKECSCSFDQEKESSISGAVQPYSIITY